MIPHTRLFSGVSAGVVVGVVFLGFFVTGGAVAIVTAGSPADEAANDSSALNVSVNSTNDPIVEGEDLTFVTDVGNNASSEEMASLELVISPIDEPDNTTSVNSTELSVPGEDIVQTDFIWTPENKSGIYNATINVYNEDGTLHDSDSVEVEVIEGYVEYELEYKKDSPNRADIDAGAQGYVVELENIGTKPGSGNITLDISGPAENADPGLVDKTNFRIEPGEQKEYSLAWTAPDTERHAGDYEFSVDPGVYGATVALSDTDDDAEDFKHTILYNDPNGASVPDALEAEASPNYIADYQVNWDKDPGVGETAVNIVIPKPDSAEGVKGVTVSFYQDVYGIDQTVQTDRYGVASMKLDGVWSEMTTKVYIEGQEVNEVYLGNTESLVLTEGTSNTPDVTRTDLYDQKIDDWMEDDETSGEPENTPELPPIPEPPGTIKESKAPVEWGETHYQVDAEEVFMFFSRDKDAWAGDNKSVDWDQVEALTDDSSNWLLAPEDASNTEKTLEMRAAAANGDQVSTERPSVTRWNIENWDEFIKSGELTFNRYSSHTLDASETESTGNISGAHATIFDVVDTTRIYESEESRPFYAPRNGRVDGFVDFAVRTEESKRVGCGYENCEERKIEYEYVAHYVEQACLHESDGEDGSEDEIECRDRDNFDEKIADPPASGVGQDFSFSYEVDEFRNNITLQLSATLVYEERRRVLDLINDDMGERWVLNKSEKRKDSIQVSDTVEVEFTDASLDVDIDRVEHPDGTVDFRLDFSPDAGQNIPSATWSTISINDTRIDSGWRYVTWRDDSWDEMIVMTSDYGGNRKYRPIATPLYANVVPTSMPVPEYPHAEPNEILKIKDGENFTSPATIIPEGIDVPLRAENESEEFAIADAIVVQHGKFGEGTISDQVPSGDIQSGSYDASSVDIDDIEVNMLMDDMNVTVEQVSDRKVQRVQMQTEYIEEGGLNGENVVKVTLLNETGHPIWTEPPERGYLEVPKTGKTYNTSNDGTVLVDLPENPGYRLRIEYKQKPWYEMGSNDLPLYQNTTGVANLDYQQDPLRLFFYIFEIMFIPGFVLGLLYLWIRRDAVLQYI